MTRRALLAGAAGAIAFGDDTLSKVLAITSSDVDPLDEAYWTELRNAFYIDPELAVFNNVGIAPPPRATVEMEAKESRRAASDPSFHIWRRQDQELDSVRRDLALLIGAEEAELALTLNATYGLQTAIMGIPMERGDEILTTTFEYPRALTAMRQRERRDGVKVVVVAFESPPLSADELCKRILAAVTPRTRLVVLSQLTYLIGQIMPISRIAVELQKLNIPLLCDAAQAIGLLPEKLSELGSPIYTACLHKWMMGPVGTGVFVVKGKWLKQMWPLHPADAGLDELSTKFEQIGTHSAAVFLALRPSIELHHRIGLANKAARIQTLRKRLAERVLELPGAKNWGSLDPNVCQAILTVGFPKIPTRDLASWLLSKHKIHVTTAISAGIDGIRISPNIFTSQSEIDRLVRALTAAAKNGI